MRKPEVFKMACLRDIQRLFGESARNPFYAGFGNRITDALSYRSVNVPSARIFTIDSSGEVKMAGSIVIIGSPGAVDGMAAKVKEAVGSVKGGGKGEKWQGKVTEWHKGEIEKLKAAVDG